MIDAAAQSSSRATASGSGSPTRFTCDGPELRPRVRALPRAVARRGRGRPASLARRRARLPRAGGAFLFDLYVPNLKLLLEGMPELDDFDGEYAPGLRLRRTVSSMPADLSRQTNRVRMRFAWRSRTASTAATGSSRCGSSSGSRSSTSWPARSSSSRRSSAIFAGGSLTPTPVSMSSCAEDRPADRGGAVGAAALAQRSWSCTPGCREGLSRCPPGSSCPVPRALVVAQTVRIRLAIQDGEIGVAHELRGVVLAGGPPARLLATHGPPRCAAVSDGHRLVPAILEDGPSVGVQAAGSGSRFRMSW